MPAPRRQAALPPVKVGNIILPRYQRGDGRIVVVHGPKRKQSTFATIKASGDGARRLARELHNNNATGIEMSQADRAEWLLYKRIVAEAGCTEPIPEILRVGIAALRKPVHTVPDVVRELLESKASSDLHGRYLRGLKKTLLTFAKLFPGPIERVSAGDIERHLAAQKAGPRRRDNLLSEIRHLFTFARGRGYLPAMVTSAAQVATIHRQGDASKIGIFTPEEIRLLLEHCDEEWLPYLSIAAFSGIRAEELALSKDAARRKDPLRWEDFDWTEGEICVRSETAKTGTPRRCPLLPNLLTWIQDHRGDTGPITPKDKRPDREFGNTGRLITAVNQALKKELAPVVRSIAWRNNALRHSYGSYRMSVLKDMQALSYEMGNSVAMIKRHYHNPRPASEAKAWFSIQRETASNVRQLGLQMV